MKLICEVCGKEFYLSEQDPMPDFGSLFCDECNGTLESLDIVEERQIDDDDLDHHDSHIPMTS